jgi:hypothetical protein
VKALAPSLPGGSIAPPAPETFADSGLAAALRTLVRFALWATALRALASAVGVWAGGTLGVASTLLIAVLAPAWLFVLFPTWIAWRGPARLRVRPLMLIACWLSPLVRGRDLRGIDVFIAAAADRPFPLGGRVPADAWTVLAAALQAERGGDLARAERLVEGLAYLPPGARFPWLARVHGVEALVRSAVARGDWNAAARYAQIGRGRAIELFDLLASTALGAQVEARVLWLRWALAPRRRQTLPLVRALLARQRAPRAVTPAPTVTAETLAEAAAVDPRLRHVRLLGAAAGGGPVAMAEVFVLAQAWQRHLDQPALARLHARALELEVRDAAEQARGLREAVLEELAVLATQAQGCLPGPGDGSLAAALADRARARLFEVVESTLVPLAPDRIARTSPLEAWERWLALRALLDRVEHQAGAVAVTTLWHARVRDAVWNWACALHNQHGARAAWAALGIFTWVADRADGLGDTRTAIINRENARIALRASEL